MSMNEVSIDFSIFFCRRLCWKLNYQFYKSNVNLGYNIYSPLAFDSLSEARRSKEQKKQLQM